MERDTRKRIAPRTGRDASTSWPRRAFDATNDPRCCPPLRALEGRLAKAPAYTKCKGVRTGRDCITVPQGGGSCPPCQSVQNRPRGSSSRHDPFFTGTKTMTAAVLQLLRPARFLLLLSAALVAPHAAIGQGDCEAIPAGRSRTDCFIGRARILNQRSTIAEDKARLEGHGARLQAATGRSHLSTAAPCQGKGAGTRACYTCCRAHGLAASRCLRNCRGR
jgi:hypothetical protein